jgi:uncharacterized paraquat-inducible protein A
MEFVRKCGKCGLDLADPTATTCPVCGTKIIALPRLNIWLGALFQVVITTIFMLAFGFPRPMIGVFVVLIVIGTAVSAWVKKNPAAMRRMPPKAIAQPVLFRVVSFGIAFCTLAFIAILLFGFVIFMNSWESWHRYEGASYHQTDFEVTRPYYQVHSRGSNEAFASGTVGAARMDEPAALPAHHAA